MTGPQRPSWRANAALLVAAVAASLVLLEIGLQTAALVVRGSLEQSPSVWQHGGAVRLLSLGDSNTFGLGVNRDQAYPRVLERFWNASSERPRLEVINLGYPGTNSSHLRNRLPKLLTMLRPDIVTVMVGVNDLWLPAEPLAEEAIGWRERLDQLAWRWSRLYRVVWMLRRALQVEMIDVPNLLERPGETLQVRLGDDRVSWPRPAAVAQPKVPRLPIGENLTALGQQVDAAGAELILLTYPAEKPFAPIYGNVNLQIRAAAESAEIRMIDLGPRISGGCVRDKPCEVLMGDHHPTALGHEAAAALILEALAQPRLTSR